MCKKRCENGAKRGHAPGKRVQKVGKKGAKKGQNSCKKKVAKRGPR